MKNIKNIVESKYPPVNNEDLWLKDGKLYHSTSLGWIPLSEEPSITETYEDHKSSISYSGKDGLKHKIELNEDMESDVTGIINDTFVTDDDDNITFTDSDDTEHTLVTTDALPSILANNNMLEVTWLQLKDLRDNSQLTAGCLYRIIDYNCTTTQENTRSAGNQFDIVLLALSENNLAEEGWAMVHDNIYDVTFTDGVTKKCWFYVDDTQRNLVDCNTLLGIDQMGLEEITLNEEDKTATCVYSSSDLDVEELTYNYFQNSNLSAWKVWYCLDNDKSRFTWADDDNEYCIIDDYIGEKAYRRPHGDIPELGLYFWDNDDHTSGLLSKTLTPKAGDLLYNDSGEANGNIVTAVGGLGHGVIYRLIDEFNNDVCYDFKNILFARPLAGGEYTPNSGTQKFVYTFNATKADNDCSDLTLHNGEETDGTICRCNDNVILPRTNPDGLGYRLNIVTFIVYHDVDDEVIGSCENNLLNNVYNFVGGSSVVGVSIYDSRFVFVNEDSINSIILNAHGNSSNMLSLSGAGVIYINDKRVLTET